MSSETAQMLEEERAYNNMKPGESINLHFHVAGEFLTDMARNFWIEGNQDRAISLLVNGLGGMTEDLALLICIGKKKLVGWDNEIDVVDDCVGEHKGMRLKSLKKSFSDKNEEIKIKEEELKDFRYPRVKRASPWGLVLIPLSIDKKIVSGEKSWEDYDEYSFERMKDSYERYRKCQFGEWENLGIELEGYAFEDHNPTFRVSEKIINKKAVSLLDIMNANYLADLTEMNKCKTSKDFEKLKHVNDQRDEFIASQYKEGEPPEQDLTLSSPFGWIDIDGKFYPCDGYMQHINLAYRFGKTENQLEEVGWVKVAQGDLCFAQRDFDFLHVGKLAINDAQWKTIEDWCMEHKRNIPDRGEL